MGELLLEPDNVADDLGKNGVRRINRCRYVVRVGFGAQPKDVVGTHFVNKSSGARKMRQTHHQVFFGRQSILVLHFADSGGPNSRRTHHLGVERQIVVPRTTGLDAGRVFRSHVRPGVKRSQSTQRGRVKLVLCVRGGVHAIATQSRRFHQNTGRMLFDTVVCKIDMRNVRQHVVYRIGVHGRIGKPSHQGIAMALAVGRHRFGLFELGAFPVLLHLARRQIVVQTLGIESRQIGGRVHHNVMHHILTAKFVRVGRDKFSHRATRGGKRDGLQIVLVCRSINGVHRTATAHRRMKPTHIVPTQGVVSRNTDNQALSD